MYPTNFTRWDIFLDIFLVVVWDFFNEQYIPLFTQHINSKGCRHSMACWLRYGNPTRMSQKVRINQRIGSVGYSPHKSYVEVGEITN